jgi:L-fuconolactonase
MTDATPRIDAHHHFWDPARFSYPWLAGAAMDPIRRAFAPDDLRGALGPERIDGTVLVQTLSSLPETRAFLELAAATDFVRGVVGWVDLTSPGVSDDLDAILGGPAGRWLVGIRHQVHDEPDPDWLARADVRRGLAAVQARGLTYDLLVRPRELPAAVEVVRSFPGLQFVLDHIAKPRIADGRDDQWSQRLPALAAQPNVAVKLSGMVTEADWATWSPRDLRPFVSQVAAWFGVERLMFGSDWPVCLLAGSYHAVLDALVEALTAMSPAELSPAELDQVLGLTARRIYQLDKSTAVAPRQS